MSSIATFYILSEANRSAFADAQRNQKTVTYNRGLFGTKEIVTGDRFLWEYLDSATTGKTDFDFSGFAFIDYLLSFVTASLPEHLNVALKAPWSTTTTSSSLRISHQALRSISAHIHPMRPPFKLLWPITTQTPTRSTLAPSARLMTFSSGGSAALTGTALA